MPPLSDNGYEFGPFRLDVAERQLLRNGEPLRVPPKAFALLVALLSRSGHLRTKDELLADVWAGTFVEEGNLAVNINTLRRLLDDGSGRSYIETVPKLGYRFIGEVRESPVGLLDEAQGRPFDDSSRPMPLAEGVAVTMVAEPVAATLVGEAQGGRGAQRPERVGARRARWWVVAACVVAGATAFSYWIRQVPAVTAGGVRSLVVMPFRAITPSSDQAYLETGMADALAARLGGVGHLRVPPTAAVRSREEPFDAGRRLTVDAVLTGSVQRSGDKLRVTAQLSRVGDGGQLWAGRFDERFTDIFTVQDAIAERIAARLLTDLSAGDRVALKRRDTTNTEAYEFYLRAREQWSRRTPESVRTAIRLYEKATAIDPQFARAHAGLADCYNLTHSGIPASVRFPLAKAAAQKAIALDPRSAEAHTSLAFQLYKFEWQWEESQREFRKAIALNPDYTLAHHWYAELLGRLGHDREAMQEFEKALALAPDSVAIRVDIALTLMRARRPSEAWPVLVEARDLDPSSGRVATVMSKVLAAMGKQDESLEYLWRGMLLQTVPESQVDELRQAYHTGGGNALKAKVIEQLLDQLARTGSPSKPGAGIASRLAWAYADAGNRERTLFWLTKATDLHEDGPIDTKTESVYDFLRGDTGFKAIQRRVGLDKPGI